MKSKTIIGLIVALNVMFTLTMLMKTANAVEIGCPAGCRIKPGEECKEVWPCDADRALMRSFLMEGRCASWMKVQNFSRNGYICHDVHGVTSDEAGGAMTTYTVSLFWKEKYKENEKEDWYTERSMRESCGEVLCTDATSSKWKVNGCDKFECTSGDKKCKCDDNKCLDKNRACSWKTTAWRINEEGGMMTNVRNPVIPTYRDKNTVMAHTRALGDARVMGAVYYAEKKQQNGCQKMEVVPRTKLHNMSLSTFENEGAFARYYFVMLNNVLKFMDKSCNPVEENFTNVYLYFRVPVVCPCDCPGGVKFIQDPSMSIAPALDMGGSKLKAADIDAVPEKKATEKKSEKKAKASKKSETKEEEASPAADDTKTAEPATGKKRFKKK